MAKVNNEFYDELGESWYDKSNFAMGILHEQGAKAINPWVKDIIKKYMADQPHTILDIGCGGGSLSNYLAKQKHQVVGIDINPNNLKVAALHDETKSVDYQIADACNLPYPDQYFSVVAAMDVIEHIEDQEKLIAEISRVLRTDGIFLFHTFNRTLAARIIGVWGLNMMPGMPWNTHVYRLFITPEELTQHCKNNQLQVQEMTGLDTRVNLWTMLKASVGIYNPEEVTFGLIPSLKASYVGIAIKK